MSSFDGTPLPWSPSPQYEQPPHDLESDLEQLPPDLEQPPHDSEQSPHNSPHDSQPTDNYDEQPLRRTRIQYTAELKLKLIQLCIDNGDRYLTTASEDEFWRYIRIQFMKILGLQTPPDGGPICRKVGTIVADLKADISVRQSGSGIAVPAATDLEQATDTWIEWVTRRGEKKQAKVAQSVQIKEEKEKASIRRNNLMKSLSQKRTYQEVAASATIDLTDSDSTSIRDRRHKTGEAWKKGKEKEKKAENQALLLSEWERQDKESLVVMKDMMLEVIKTVMNPTISESTSAASTSTSAASTSTSAASTSTSASSASTSVSSASTSASSASTSASSTSISASSASTSTSSASTSVSMTTSTSASTLESTLSESITIEARLTILEQGQLEILRLLKKLQEDKE